MTLPLAGVRILDFSRVLSGPYGTMFLADLGADVVKVEHPGHGDDTRIFGPPFIGGVSTYFLSINRGKRSIALDLKDPADRETARKLAMVADVVIENFRPGVMDRLGLGAEALRAERPELIYCTISGFGSADRRPGYDLMVQGMSGVPSLTGPADQGPYKCPASIADMVAGLHAVQGLLAALYRREKTGEGAFIDVPMLDGQLALLSYHASAWLNAGKQPTRLGNAHPSIHPFCSYAAADGHINVCVGNEALWKCFCDVLGHPEWTEDERFLQNRDRVAHREALDILISEVLLTRSTAEWLSALGEAGVPCGPMSTIPDALSQATLAEHPHPAGEGTVQTVALPYIIDDLPRAAERGAPSLGEHNAEVLAEWLK